LCLQMGIMPFGNLKIVYKEETKCKRYLMIREES